MADEAIAQGIQISPAQLADFESRVGSNPALAADCLVYKD
jgi:hypothetical protein